MQSTNEAKPRERKDATSKDAITRGAGLVVLALLFAASLGYVALGGAFALEASPLAEPEVSIAKLALIAANAGGARRDETVSGSRAQPADYVPAGYGNPGRDGDGNVMTYEHD